MTKPAAPAFEDANKFLTRACQDCFSECCKKGKIFLLPEEVEAIENWLPGNAPEKIGAFRERLRPFPQFVFVEQHNRCVFLDESGLCELHVAGVKPEECFLWPLYVFVDELGTIDIRVFRECCQGHKAVTFDHPSVEKATIYARRIGYERLLSFRAAYSGDKIYDDRILRRLELEPQNVRPVQAAEKDEIVARLARDAGRDPSQLEALGPGGIHVHESGGHVTGCIAFRDDGPVPADGGVPHWEIVAMSVSVPEGQARISTVWSLLRALGKRVDGSSDAVVYARGGASGFEAALLGAGFRKSSLDHGGELKLAIRRAAIGHSRHHSPDGG